MRVVTLLSQVNEFFKLFVVFAKTYGLRRASLKVIIWSVMGLLAPHREIKVKPRFGCELFLIPNDVGISAELRSFKIHEPLASKVLIREVKRGKVVVDVGSNIGYYVTLESKLVGIEGIIIAIEPNPLNFSYLLKNIKLNRLNNVITINKAISDENGTVEMIKSNRSNWSRIPHNYDDLALPDNMGVFKVKAITLDNLVEQLGLERVDLIRMDVEGYEDHIIKSSEKTMRRYLPDILVEIHKFLLDKDRILWLLSRFNDIGYKVKYVIPRNVDFALLCRDSDITVKNLDELASNFTPDAFSVYLTARHAQI